MPEISLVEVLRQLEAAGYPGRLAVEPGGRIRCTVCGQTSPASAWTIEQTRRLEGDTDPGEELLVVGVRGPDGPCGHRGALVLGYGPEATPEDAAVLVALSMDRAGVAPDAPGGRST